MMRKSVLLVFVAFAPLILICDSQAAPTPTCTHSEVMKKTSHMPVAVMRGLPQKGKGDGHTYTAVAAQDDEWNPLRIFVSTKDLENSTRYCTDDIVNKNHIARPRFDGSFSSCSWHQALTDSKKEMLIKKMIPAVIKLHTERLLVQPLKTNLTLPNLSKTPCGHFTIPEEHHTTGIPNADMVLYLASAFGGVRTATCATLNNSTGRPIAASMIVDPRYIKMENVMVRYAAHELAHALGFNYATMQAHKMFSNISNVREKPYAVGFVVSEKTKEAVRNHFNCSTAVGMELEDEDRFNHAEAHWERRNAKDELMSGALGIGLYTALTMAYFEDLGYYKAQWGMEEHMSWGEDAGCSFLESKCIEKGRNSFPNMFCTEKDPKRLFCTSDRLAVATCDIEVSDKPVPSHFQYFQRTNVTAPKFDLLDRCPVIDDNKVYCTSTKSHDEMKKIGSLVGENSLCLTGRSLRIDGESVGDVCAKVRCNSTSRTVEVQYLGNETYHLCPYGNMITAYGVFSGGRIKCPSYEEVCTVAHNGTSLVTPNRKESSIEKSAILKQ